MLQYYKSQRENSLSQRKQRKPLSENIPHYFHVLHSSKHKSVSILRTNVSTSAVFSEFFYKAALVMYLLFRISSVASFNFCKKECSVISTVGAYLTDKTIHFFQIQTQSADELLLCILVGLCRNLIKHTSHGRIKLCKEAGSVLPELDALEHNKKGKLTAVLRQSLLAKQQQKMFYFIASLEICTSFFVLIFSSRATDTVIHDRCSLSLQFYCFVRFSFHSNTTNVSGMQLILSQFLLFCILLDFHPVGVKSSSLVFPVLFPIIPQLDQ